MFTPSVHKENVKNEKNNEKELNKRKKNKEWKYKN